MDILRAAAMPVNPIVDLVSGRIPSVASNPQAADQRPEVRPASQANSLGDPSRPPSDVGTQFESLFVSLLLKEMRQTLETGSLFGEDGGDILGGLFDTYLGEHLARAGSLRIADMVNRTMTPAQRT